MMTKRCVYLLALLSILFLPSIATAQAIGLAVFDDNGKRVGPIVGVQIPRKDQVLVYYVGDPSQATYFQFKDYAFLSLLPGPSGFRATVPIYWTLPFCQGDPYLNFRMETVFDSVVLDVYDLVLGKVLAPMDPAQTFEPVDIQSIRLQDGECRADIRSEEWVPVEPVNLDLTPPFHLERITDDVPDLTSLQDQLDTLQEQLNNHKHKHKKHKHKKGK